MSQQEVLNCLEKSKNPLTVNQIVIILKGRREAVQRALRVMNKFNEVKRIVNKEDKRKYSYMII